MNGRQRMQKAMRFEPLDRYPLTVGMLPYISQHRQQERDDFLARFQMDDTWAPIRWGKSRYLRGTPYVIGSYVDEFGCGWYCAEDGVVGEVKAPAIDEWHKLDTYRLPWEILREADTADMQRHYDQTDKFAIAGSWARPFERLQFLRGSETLFYDMGYADARFLKLKDMLFEFDCEHLRLLAQSPCDHITFMDDWGSQTALLISPKMWREYFKPMYKTYVDIIHSGGKTAHFHSDGYIEAIYPDLIEIGVDTLNSQLFCMDPARLIDTYGDKICFWGELDRQHTLGFGTPDDVRREVDLVADALYKKHGMRTGGVAQFEWGSHDPYENIVAAAQRWMEK